MCLDTFGRKAGEKVGMADCHGLGGNQVCFRLYYTWHWFIFILISLLLTHCRCTLSPALLLYNTGCGCVL